MALLQNMTPHFNSIFKRLQNRRRFSFCLYFFIVAITPTL